MEGDEEEGQEVEEELCWSRGHSESAELTCGSASRSLARLQLLAERPQYSLVLSTAPTCEDESSLSLQQARRRWQSTLNEVSYDDVATLFLPTE